MKKLLALASAVALLAGCGGTPPAPTASQTTPTTTGLLPTGVPTEGTRPPAEALPPPAEPGRAPVPATTPPGRVVPVGGDRKSVV